MLVKMLSVWCVNSVLETPYSEKLSDTHKLQYIDRVKGIVSWQLQMGIKMVEVFFFPNL